MGVQIFGFFLVQISFGSDFWFRFFGSDFWFRFGPVRISLVQILDVSDICLFGICLVWSIWNVFLLFDR